MAGINTIQDMYKKHGETWIRDFFSKGAMVSEKTDAYRFSFELSKTGRLKFYGKNAESPLNRIDRTVSDLYESAIEKIEKLPEAIIINLPKNHRFGFSWSLTEGLVLTDITIRNKGKVVKQIQETELVEKWASLLHVSAGTPQDVEPLVIESTIKKLRGGGSLNEIWDPTKTYILRNSENVVKIGESAKKEKAQKSHSFDLLLMQIFEYVQKVNFDKFIFKSPRPDERYLEAVCESFNGFVKDHGTEFLEMGVEKPAFLEKSGKFNRKWLRNKETLSIIENKNYEYLLSIFIVNLRKPKKAVGLLSEGFVEMFNQKIGEIDESVKNPEEPGFPEFSSILEREEPSLDSDYKQADLGNDSGYSSEDHMKAVGMLQTYFAQPFMNTNEDSDNKEKVQECDAIYINTGEITKKVINECERLLKLNERSLMLIHNESAGSHCKWGLEKNEGRSLANRLVEAYPHIFECSESLSNPSLHKIVKAGKPRKIKNIYVAHGGNRLTLEKDMLDTLGRTIEGVEVKPFQLSQGKEIEECMESADAVKFRQVFPEVCLNYWPSMMTNWNTKAYL